MKEALVKNAADPNQVKKAENKIINGEERERLDLEFILSSREGRRFVWRMMTKFGFLKTSFTGNSSTFFQEGERNVALFLYAEIDKVSPDAFELMRREAREQF